MTDHRLRGALSGADTPGWYGAQTGLARLTLRARVGLTILLLRGRTQDASFAAGVESALGLPLPQGTGTTTCGERIALLALGPDEWLATGHLAPDAVAALRARSSAVTDVSHGRTAIRVSGTTARDLLAKGLPLDLHPSAFPAGRCAQSTLARCNVVVHCVDDAPTFDLYVMRSYARSLWHFLCEAGKELGYEIVAPSV